MIKKTETYDIVVVGGGLAGVSAALAGARLGRKTALVHERPVLGGNSSSEIRVTPHGAAAFHHYARETGLIHELQEEERYRNHLEISENGWTNSVWDMVLYDTCISEEFLSLFLNTSVFGIELSDRKTIGSIRARILGAETELELKAGVFIDATGDGYIADSAGCESMRGSESREIFGEIHAPDTGHQDDEMGSSLHFHTVDTGHPVEFKAPDWAVSYDDPSFFKDSGRKIKDLRGGFWWIEIARPWNTITDTETIRYELTRHLLGIWDWIKNKDPETKEKCRNLALDWIGQVPGKRESRRIIGRYLMTENDIQNKTPFKDEIAFGGWFLDLHTPGGLLAEIAEERSKESYSPYGQKSADSYVGPYSIPFGVMCPRGIDNLLLAGRALSLTHTAFGTVRVMNTLAIAGQAAGTAAVRSLDTERNIPNLDTNDIHAIQQRLLRDDSFLLGQPGSDSCNLAESARISASSQFSLSGADPDDTWADGGISYWKDQINPDITERLDTVHAQLIPLSDEVHSISLFLSNDSETDVSLPVTLRKSRHIWDYNLRSEDILAAVTLLIHPGKAWYSWDINLPSEGLRFIRLEAGPSDRILWHLAGPVVPSCVSYFKITENRLRTFGQGATLSFRIEPPQNPYPPEQITSGWTRPYKESGCWRSSDIHKTEEEWICLDWDRPVLIGEVQITFPGQILREYHAYPPGYRNPQVPRDYVIEGCTDSSGTGKWTGLARVRNNYRRFIRHEIRSNQPFYSIRLRVTSTNGDNTVTVYEMRCYEKGSGPWCD
jgi:hypothetical protein